MWTDTAPREMLGIKVEYTEETNMMDSVPVSASGSKTGLQPQQGVPYDLESGFEPQTRARSHTWPLPRPEEYIEGNVVPSVAASKEGVEGVESGTPPQHGSLGQGTGLLPVKKNSSRRNAWGNHSYADLITQAITSAPDERLTLSQIYEWMMQNIPYFREKGESNSSAGWKVSFSFFLVRLLYLDCGCLCLCGKLKCT